MGQFSSRLLNVYTVYTVCTPSEKHPKKWDSLLHNLPDTQRGGEHMIVAMSREETDLCCRQAQEMLERNGILMRSCGSMR
ncbi:uncharacterized protein N7487_002090 [Penicillium crustosum]|uniref:uncharacterized protein n=1 Tax=Penicillium crustosum TaxID=36656 RepID=UPI0023929138|nr:uncharacterized protein N7487_002090 [Penicillium crustosum]KAJ5418540.1 hypothetical protein N7487_002090 [Penicillium crustosum]